MLNSIIVVYFYLVIEMSTHGSIESKGKAYLEYQKRTAMLFI